MVRTGLMELLDGRLDILAGRRIGLVSHNAAVLPDLSVIVEALLDANVKLAALFGPEHGFAGAAPEGAEVLDGVDRHTGLPLYSLYGEVKEPSPAMLSGLEALVVDFQDVGARYYTFLSTLYYILRSASGAGLPVFVLDRPNPLNGLVVEGPLVDPGFESFVGIAPIPIRHGLTMGELALFLNTELNLDAALTVVPMEGWQRAMWFDETGLPWVLPSPAMPHLSTATVYPGTCFLEGTNLSEGRGTALPFEIAGAPWLDGYALAERLNKLILPGVRFRPHMFQPTGSKFAGQVCEGVQVHVFDRLTFHPVLTGLHLLATARELALESFEFLKPGLEGKPLHLDLLAGTAHLREYLVAGRMVDEIAAEWAPVSEEWQRVREPYLLYR
ncbi:MAG: DUF1343 domain-containing protein [Chloroflexi bacterium]|nr:MAG: DUF1343 domain-containing protein [Chloroflexota bacterium]